MDINKLKIVIWCGAGGNQKALANRIAAKFNVAGIVIDTHTTTRKRKKISHLPMIFWDRFRFRIIYNAWSSLMKYYNQIFPKWPDVLIIEVPEINDQATGIFTKKLEPDLIVVSGTGLIKEQLLNTPASIGIINLHTGLSPYVKGGPNCTNWCIANNTFHLVGNTIMWLNAGIDAGNIITTETVSIYHAADLDEAHRIVMDHAHDLYTRAVRYIAKTVLSYNSVPQSSIDKGKLYLTKMWTGKKKKQLLKNWKKRKSFIAPFSPKTVGLKIDEL